MFARMILHIGEYDIRKSQMSKSREIHDIWQHYSCKLPFSSLFLMPKNEKNGNIGKSTYVNWGTDKIELSVTGMGSFTDLHGKMSWHQFESPLFRPWTSPIYNADYSCKVKNIAEKYFSTEAVKIANNQMTVSWHFQYLVGKV